MDPFTRRWLARLSFPFFILAFMLVWQIYRIQNGQLPPQPAWRLTLYAIGAMIGIVLGFLGIRERHRGGD